MVYETEAEHFMNSPASSGHGENAAGDPRVSEGEKKMDSARFLTIALLRSSAAAGWASSTRRRTLSSDVLWRLSLA